MPSCLFLTLLALDELCREMSHPTTGLIIFARHE